MPPFNIDPMLVSSDNVNLKNGATGMDNALLNRDGIRPELNPWFFTGRHDNLKFLTNRDH